MMKTKMFPMMVMMLLVAGILSGQSTKTIREKKISSITVHEYFLEEGMDDPVVESIEKYNESGDLLEIQTFNSRGEVRKWEKYAYNEEGKLVGEIFMDPKGRVTRTEKTIYTDNLRIEKQFYNNKDMLYKRKIYKYEFRE